jgi:hypothetical protein
VAALTLKITKIKGSSLRLIESDVSASAPAPP